MSQELSNQIELAEEIWALTRHLANDREVPSEWLGERPLKVALRMLQRPLSDAPVAEQDLQPREVLAALRAVMVEHKIVGHWAGPDDAKCALESRLKTDATRIQELDKLCFDQRESRKQAIRAMEVKAAGILRHYLGDTVLERACEDLASATEELINEVQP